MIGRVARGYGGCIGYVERKYVKKPSRFLIFKFLLLVGVLAGYRPFRIGLHPILWYIALSGLGSWYVISDPG
jgi:hypothetical protein